MAFIVLEKTSGGWKMIFWCDKCKIPYVTFSNETCRLCGTEGKALAHNLAPVFRQEKKILTEIMKKDLTQTNVWHMNGSYYLIDGKKVKVPYVEYLKNKQYIISRDRLMNNIDFRDEITNEELWLEANKDYIKMMVYEAENYIQQTIKKYGNRAIPIVSFSGGKDSTVVSQLVRDSLQRQDVIHFFADTSLEFPLTYNYCQEVFKTENPYTPVVFSETDKNFFEMCDIFGPPSQHERWCCTIFKTGNLSNIVNILPGDKHSLTFAGIRRMESNTRKNYDQTRTDSKISRQIVAMPIIDWSDYDVWLYIKYRKIKFNNAYKLGYKRVGCWCCPNNSSWSDLMTAIYMPDLYKKWHEKLYGFARKANKIDIDDYVNNDKWKARIGASGLESKNTDIIDTECLLQPQARNIWTEIPVGNDFIELLKPFGNAKINEIGTKINVEVYENDKKRFSLEYKKDGQVIKIIPVKGYDYLTLTKRIKCQLRKYQYCVSCGACEAICSQAAICVSNSEYIIDDEKCIHCKACIAHFYNGCLTTKVLSERKGGAIKN